jgi:hypothetical protein
MPLTRKLTEEHSPEEPSQSAYEAYLRKGGSAATTQSGGLKEAWSPS